MCKIELGFKENEIQHIVLAVPKVLTANKRKLTQMFDFLHNIMKVPHHLITKFPQVICAAIHNLMDLCDIFNIMDIKHYICDMLQITT